MTPIIALLPFFLPTQQTAEIVRTPGSHACRIYGDRDASLYLYAQHVRLTQSVWESEETTAGRLSAAARRWREDGYIYVYDNTNALPAAAQKAQQVGYRVRRKGELTSEQKARILWVDGVLLQR